MYSRKELQIVSAFRRNARESLTTASRKLRIPVSTLYDRLRKYEGQLIVKHTALLDFAKMGFMIRMILFFKTPKEKRESIEEYLLKHHRINTIHRMSNGTDYMIEVLFRSLKEQQAFSESIELLGAVDRQEHFVVEDLKREGFLTTDDSVEILADN